MRRTKPCPSVFLLPKSLAFGHHIFQYKNTSFSKIQSIFFSRLSHKTQFLDILCIQMLKLIPKPKPECEDVKKKTSTELKFLNLPNLIFILSLPTGEAIGV